MLKAPDRRKLQRMIDRTVRTATAYHHAQAELNEWCGQYYGAEPGDIDADQIIDGVMGGCGAPSGMSAEEFDEIMREGTSNG